MNASKILKVSACGLIVSGVIFAAPIAVFNEGYPLAYGMIWWLPPLLFLSVALMAASGFGALIGGIVLVMRLLRPSGGGPPRNRGAS